MTGGTNFDTGALTAVLEDSPTRLMIIGAHVKYTTLSAKTEFCPSITAVVASTNTSAVHYPGSIRVQQQFEHINPDNLKKRRPETTIGLLSMIMQERFRAWTDDAGPPNAVLFYRDSVSFGDKAVKKECEDINDAYRRVFPAAQPPQLAYVVVNKNAHLTRVEPFTPPKQSAEEERNAPVSPIMDFGLEPESDGQLNKYKYYVIENSIGLAKENQADLVSSHPDPLSDSANARQTLKLNKSSQLSPQNDAVTKALLLTFARKLASRVYSYYLPAGVTGSNKPHTRSTDVMIYQQLAKEKALELLGRRDPNSSPWPAGLRDKMFYL
jgi:hypothetical protein